MSAHQHSKSDQEKTTIQGSRYRWHLKNADMEAIRNISRTHNLSLPVAQTLFSRGFVDAEKIRSFLFTSFEQDVPNARLMKGLLQAVERILQAIERKEKILIFGDYDVDGVTSSSLMLLGLIPLGANVNFFLPNRKRDGYGISSTFIKKAVESGYKLIITVDNGITAHQPARDALELGIDLIITDHHKPHDEIPQAYAVINPNQEDCPYPYKYLAGVGVAFKLISMIYEQKGLTLPDKVYELLMLGTVADVVPMTGENRYWIRHGLSKINKQRSLALSVLANNNNLTKEHLSSLDIGFMITPQINALGRLDDCREAVKFMISSDVTEVQRIGTILKTMNESRKKVELDIYDQVEGAIINNRINLEEERVIMAAHSEWPAGVIGLVAGKLMHAYGRPTFLFHHDKKNSILKGSCRSISEFSVFNALVACKDLLINFGGHAQAAGLALAQKNLPEFKSRIEALVAEQVTPENLQPKITLDAYLELSDAQQKLMSDMAQLEPFGNSNAQPTFLIKNVTLLKPPTILKDKHVKCSLFADGIIKQIIFFNRPDLYPALMNVHDQPFHVAAHVVTNEWQGKRSIELQGLDIAFQQ